jgi:tetratricopeptide (TPR) repeat protein
MVSSKIDGLNRERRAIKNTLEDVSPAFRVWLSEDWGSDGHSSEETCITLARECDLFILLLGKRYGNKPAGHTISVTEMEFEAARTSYPRKIRAYLKQNKSIDPEQVKFIERVRDFHSGLLCPRFSTLEELKKLVISDAVTYHGNPQRLSPQLFQHYYSILPPGIKHTKTQGPIFPPQKDRLHSKRSQITNLIEKQLTYLQNSIHKMTSSKLAKELIYDLDSDDLSILALIAQGNILTRKEYLETLFPEIKWSGIIPRIRRRGLIVLEAGHIYVADNVKKQLEQNKTLNKKTHETWVSVLVPKAGYTDLALALCLHLIALKQWSAAVEHAHSMMLAVEERFTAKLFYDMLTKLKTSRVYRKISAHDRILLFDAIGVFQTHEGHYKHAIKTFNTMLTISRRAKDGWGIRQALLHRGVAWAHFGDDRRAQHNYQQAADLARKEKDEILLGRILHNLSQCQMALDSQLAAKTLEESIIHKKRSGDQEGLFAAYTGLGILAGQAKDHKVALQWFRGTKV